MGRTISPDDHRAADNPVYVDDVADDLGITTRAARAALHAVGRYGDVREGRRYGTGGGTHDAER